MKSLLLVGDASSIFFINYVRALKENEEIEVTVYSPIIERFSNDRYPYDFVYFDDYGKSWLSKIRFFGTRLQPFFNRLHFGRFLKNNNRKYDIIHFHWILPSWVLLPKSFTKYGCKIGATLWGGELETLELVGSHKLYLCLLQNFLEYSDFYIGSCPMYERLIKICPSLEGKCHYGIYGSSIIDEIYRLKMSNKEAKATFNISERKITILLGYSGKTIHRHIEIINCIVAHPQFESVQNRIHFMVSMTRGATPMYMKAVKEKLNESGCSYTLIENTYQTDKDVAIFRKATDIAFQLSEYDGLSNSIKEILTAGSVMICGNWFPNYYILKEDGFTYIEVTDMKNGVKEMYHTIENEFIRKDIKENNSKVGYKKYLWSECIKDFADAYNKQF